MNIRKVTPAIKQDIILLYKQSLSIGLIAKTFGFSMNVVSEAIPKDLKANREDFKEGTNENKVHLLKLYAWLVSDETDCVATVGTPAIAKSGEYIYEFLRLKNWELFLSGIITYKDTSESNRYADDVAASDIKLINEILPTSLMKTSGKKLLSNALMSMHLGEIPFPNESQILDPTKSLQAFIKKKLVNNEPTNRIFDNRFAQQVHQLAVKVLSQREIDILTIFKDSTLEKAAAKYDLTRERTCQIKDRSVRRLRLHVEKFFDSSLVGYIEKQVRCEKLEQQLKDTVLESSQLNNAAKVVQDKLVTELNILKNYINNKPVDRATVNEILKKDQALSAEDSMQKILGRSIAEFDLSVRAYNCLKAAGVTCLRELVILEREDLLKFRNFGKCSMAELDQLIDEYGFKWGTVFV